MKVNLPKKALQRIQIGQSFAEYDIVREDQSVFVSTPASLVALQPENPKCFFVGRRGAGKTAIAYHILSTNRQAVAVGPQVFDLIKLPVSLDQFMDTRQRAFKSLVCVFERALLGSLASLWLRNNLWSFPDETTAFTKERGLIENCDFDTRILNLMTEVFDAYCSPNEKLWLRQISRAQQLIDEANTIRQDASYDFVAIIDRLDEAWDGSEGSVVALMALMHCCVRLNAACRAIRPYLFLRENIYSRIRQIDNEFSRLETSVVFLEWTKEQLIELVERRLVRPFNTKPALGGEAWDHFFEDTATFDSRTQVLKHCQGRPRDVLTYVSFALEAAVARSHGRITEEDVTNARDRFSTSKLKDLADEIAENYPNIHLVLQLFYGLSTDYSLPAIENFIQKLLIEARIGEHCKSWLFEFSTPHRFVELLFNIGFLGVKSGKEWIFKSTSGDAAFLPAIQRATIVRIHPAYHTALHLREMVLPEISDDLILQHTGILEELPDGVSFDGYQHKLSGILHDLDKLPRGTEGAYRFEELVGDMIKLCFFRSLTNVQPKVRSRESTVIRDWIASNRASSGFWAVMRNKYHATQVIWECKNYDNLSADDFQQTAYYMNNTAGRLVVVVFRAQELDNSYARHVERIANDKQGMVLLLTEKDVRVFLRQAMNGKFKEDHINEVYDRVCRAIS